MIQVRLREQVTTKQKAGFWLILSPAFLAEYHTVEDPESSQKVNQEGQLFDRGLL